MSRAGRNAEQENPACLPDEIGKPHIRPFSADEEVDLRGGERDGEDEDADGER